MVKKKCFWNINKKLKTWLFWDHESSQTIAVTSGRHSCWTVGICPFWAFRFGLRKNPKDFIESDDSNVQGPMSFLGSMKIVENHVVITVWIMNVMWPIWTVEICAPNFKPSRELGGFFLKNSSHPKLGDWRFGRAKNIWLVGGCCWISVDAKKLDEWIIVESFTMARITSNINAQFTDSHGFTTRTIRVPRYWIDIESYSHSFSKPRLNNPVLNQLTSQFLGL